MLLVVPDARAPFQRALPEHELQTRNLREKGVADRLSATLVGTRLGALDLGIAFHDVAARRRFLRRPGLSRCCSDGQTGE